MASSTFRFFEYGTVNEDEETTSLQVKESNEENGGDSKLKIFIQGSLRAAVVIGFFIALAFGVYTFKNTKISAVESTGGGGVVVGSEIVHAVDMNQVATCYDDGRACTAATDGTLPVACKNFAGGYVIGRLIDQKSKFDVSVKPCIGQTTQCTVQKLKTNTTYTLQCVPVCGPYNMQVTTFDAKYNGKVSCFAPKTIGGYSAWCNSNPAKVSLISGFGIAGNYLQTKVQIANYCSTVSGQTFSRCGGPFFLSANNVFELTCSPQYTGKVSNIVPSDFGTAWVQCPYPSKIDTVTTLGDTNNYALHAVNWPYACRGWSTAILYYDKVTPKPCLVGNLNPAKVYSLTCSVF